jgi:hypothetical protein
LLSGTFVTAALSMVLRHVGGRRLREVTNHHATNSVFFLAERMAIMDNR